MPDGLYPPMPGSPVTYLDGEINASVTTITVKDISALPLPPNIATMGDGADSETIKYTGKSGNSLIGVVRGFEGAAREWNSGAPIANVPCAHHVTSLQRNLIPKGCILMWGGAINNIPQGWALCNGENGTPDLRDRFILGVSQNEEPGGTGGDHSKTIVVGNLPPHGHPFTTGTESKTHKHAVTVASGGTHNHTGRSKGFTGVTASRTGWYFLRRVVSGDAYDDTPTITHSSGGAHAHSTSVGNASATHTHSGTTGNAGSGSALDVRPKYYKLAFIMKV